MKAKNMDKRINRTRKLLQEALVSLILEKGYDKVTVQAVIDRANVGRSTFYSHFQNIDDLLLSQLDDVRERFIQHLESQAVPAENLWEFTFLVFQQAQSQRLLYKALIGERGGNVVMMYINGYFPELIKEYLKTRPLNRPPRAIPLEILTHFIVSSLNALLIWWLDHDSPYSAEWMNDVYRDLIEHGVETALVK